LYRFLPDFVSLIIEVFRPCFRCVQHKTSILWGARRRNIISQGGRGIFFFFYTLTIFQNNPTFGETPTDSFANYYKNADSLLNQLIDRPETRSKEIAPAESLYWKILLSHTEIALIARTNSKGLIVNIASRKENVKASGLNVSKEKWHCVPQETMKPYHGPLVQLSGGKRQLFYRSRPILIKNSNGELRFGGVVVLKVMMETSLPVSSLSQINQELQPHDTARQMRLSDTNAVKQLQLPETLVAKKSQIFDTTAAQQNRTPETIAAKQTKTPEKIVYKQSQIEATVNGKSSDAEKGNPLRTPDTFSHVVRWVLRISGSIIIVIAVIFGIVVPQRRKKRKQNNTSGSDVAINDNSFKVIETTNQPPDGLDTAAANDHMPPHQLIIEPDLHGGSIPPLYDPVVHEETINLSVKTIPEKKGGDNEIPSKNEMRAEFVAEIKKEIMEKEINNIRNSVIAELKTDIREKIEKHEAESIRTHIRQELTDAWRQNIQESYQEAFYRQELESLKKTIREKLIENEMPPLVKSHRASLSKEIREKMVASFSDQIEQHERAVLKSEIVKKLQSTEYPQLFQEEREKLRASLKSQIEEKETAAIEIQLRDELTSQLFLRIQTETDSIRNRLRQEMIKKIEVELREREYEAMISGCRDSLKERIGNEIIEKESKAIHDTLVAELTERQRVRITNEDLPHVIEEERNRIRNEEAPGLREQIRTQLHREELETIHGEVKKEIYSEIEQAIQSKCERNFKELLDKRMAEFRETLDKQVHSEIKKNIFTEYQNLTEHMERLSSSINNVEALDSLSKTITLLCDEKKKYKYFNLNTAQTESLLEYLKRVQSRFNIFIDKIDQAMLELKLKINSIMNSLEK
jgi:hypothetical protein